MKPLAILGRRSAGRYAGAFGGAFMLWSVLAHPWWLFEWQSAVQATTNYLVFLLPAVVIASALDARALLGRHSCARPQHTAVRKLAGLVLASALWPGAALVSVLITVAAWNLGAGTFAVPSLPSIALPFAWVILAVLVGYVSGLAMPPFLVVLTAVVLGYLLPVLLAAEPDTRLALLTPVDDGSVSPPLFLRGGVVAGQVAVCLVLVGGLSVVLLGAAGWRAFSSWDWALAIAVPVLVAAVVWSALPVQRRVEVSDAPGPRICEPVPSRATVCVWPDHVRLIEPVSRAWSLIAATLPRDWDGRPRGFAESGLAHPGDWIQFTTGTATTDVATMLSSIAGDLARELYCPDGGYPRDAAGIGHRLQWLLVSSSGSTSSDADASVRDVLEMESDDQWSWWLEPEGRNNRCS